MLYDNLCYDQGRIQDFKLGGVHLNKIAPSVGVFRVKNHDFTPKNIIFSNFRGGRAPGAARNPPWIRPCAGLVVFIDVTCFGYNVFTNVSDD